MTHTTNKEGNMTTVSISKIGRVMVELDGYSEGYRAYIQGAVVGKISLPGKYADLEIDLLTEIAKDCLADKEAGTENREYYGAHVIRAARKIQ